MQCLKTLCNEAIKISTIGKITFFTPRCGIKFFKPPPNYDHIVIPEKPKLRFFEKVPMYPSMIKPPKMQKRLRYMRGPEEIHNTLQLKQYGVIATCGGRMEFEHFEFIRLQVARKLDIRRMFAIWRVDPPWQPLTRKGQGQRMGGGKGSIDRYVTPVKGGRVIMEIGGKCEFSEVHKLLNAIGHAMPFRTKSVSHEMLLEEEAKKKRSEEANTNRYTMKYCMQNNMGGCKDWLAPVDMKWYGEYR